MSRPDLSDPSTRRAWRAYAAAALQGILASDTVIPPLTEDRVLAAAEAADLMLLEEQRRR